MKSLSYKVRLNRTQFKLQQVLAVLIALFTLAMIPVQSWSAPAKPITLMVVPQFTAEEINSNWGKVIREANTQLKRPIELIFAKDITEFETRFLAGEADLIYCNPYHMVIAKKAQGYEPLIRDAKVLKGILIVSSRDGADSIQQLSDLNGKTVLFPSPNAYGASLYMRALLTREFGIQFTPKYVKTHPNVIRGVIRNEGQAGGMVTATFQNEEEDTRSKVRILYETPPSAPHPIAAHPRMPESTRKSIQEVLLKVLKLNPSMAAEIQIPNPETSSYANDYRGLESLGLETFVAK